MAKNAKASQPEASATEHGSNSFTDDGKPVRSAIPTRRALIAETAYFRSERRNFAPGRELQDWLEAEAEVDRLGL